MTERFRTPWFVVAVAGLFGFVFFQTLLEHAGDGVRWGLVRTSFGCLGDTLGAIRSALPVL